MNVSELITHLENVKDEHGDLHVAATCDGYLPPEVAIRVQPNRPCVVLYGANKHDSYLDDGPVSVVEE